MSNEDILNNTTQTVTLRTELWVTVRATLETCLSMNLIVSEKNGSRDKLEEAIKEMQRQCQHFNEL